MSLHGYRHDQDAVVDALKRGKRPDMATTMSAGPLDKLVALHDELGVFDAPISGYLMRRRTTRSTTRRPRGVGGESRTPCCCERWPCSPFWRPRLSPAPPDNCSQTPPFC